MTRAEWVELAMICAVTTVGWFVWPNFSVVMPLWQIVLGASALLLAQSLVRDVAILIRQRRSASNQPHKEAQCFCLESAVGATGVGAGAALAGLSGSTQIAIGRLEFLIVIAATMALGFLIKDFVISWKPIGLRREKDHLNLIVRWKRKSN